MKFAFALAIISLLPLPALAAEYPIKAGYVGCLSETALDEYIAALVNEDAATRKRLYTSKKCITLKAGLRGHLLDTAGILSPKVKLSIKGHQLWTVREALVIR